MSMKPRVKWDINNPECIYYLDGRCCDCGNSVPTIRTQRKGCSGWFHSLCAECVAALDRLDEDGRVVEKNRDKVNHSGESKACKVCGNTFYRKRNCYGEWESPGQWNRRTCCNRDCAVHAIHDPLKRTQGQLRFGAPKGKRKPSAQSVG